ncbi:MAG: helix-turn-helix transcriptional regulator [bacterium]|nr:helix-turn-helix transcriptional regulator [bacterium]
MIDNKTAEPLPPKRKKNDYGTGFRLKQIRQATGFSMAKIAAFMGLSRTTYYRNETGEIFPNPRTMEILSVRLGISLDWFILGLEPMYRAPETSTTESPEEPATESPSAPTDEANENTEYFGLEQLVTENPDIEEMFTAMLNVPLIKYELLADFQRLKIKNKKLLQADTTDSP